MPRYFFDVYDGFSTVRDVFGADLDSIEDAAEEAAALLPDLAREAFPCGSSRDFAAVVRDQADAVVYRAALVFRGQRMGPPLVGADAQAREGQQLIAEALAARQALKAAAARLDADVRDFLAAMQDTLRSVADMRAEADGQRR